MERCNLKNGTKLIEGLKNNSVPDVVWGFWVYKSLPFLKGILYIAIPSYR